MSTTLDPAERRRRRQRWLGGAAAAVVLVVGAVLAVVALRAPAGEPVTTVTEQPAGPVDGGAGAGGDPVVLAAPPARSGRCAVPTPALLGGADLALEGTVSAVEGDTAVLEVAQWYAGDPGATAATTVELRSPGELAGLVGGVPTFEVGQRWLVAASGGTVAVCGFTTPWSPAQARLYEQAFGS